MNRQRALFPPRLRKAVACAFLLAAVALLWAGFGLSRFLPAPALAVAGSAPSDLSGAPLDGLPKERAALLQSTVDSVALSLGGAFAFAAQEDGAFPKKQALAGALNALTFNLGSEVYFTAWQGTRIVHSPMNPDAGDLDFAEALDERGAAFVRDMERAAGERGGFIRAMLPRQMPHQPTPLRLNKDAAEITRELDNLAGAIAGENGGGGVARGRVIAITLRSGEEAAFVKPADSFCPGNTDKASCISGKNLPAPDSTPVKQVIYVRRIPASDWHIAAFMPEETSRRAQTEAFSAAWRDKNDTEAENLRKGLCVSGFSLAGLAGLMFAPGIAPRRRERDGKHAS